MHAYDFPSDPAERRAIIVLDQVDITKSIMNGGNRELYNSQSYLLPFPLNQPLQSPTLLKLQRKNLIRPGSVLVQSPFDPDDYEEGTEAADMFALQKHQHFSTLCMYLGAKKVRVDQIEKQVGKKTSTIDLKAERLGASGDITYTDENLGSFRKRMQLTDEFDGNQPDIEAAQNHLIAKGLMRDTSMQSLLEMRKHSSNPIKKRSLVLNLSSEAKKNISLAAKIALPALINLSADYANELSKEREYSITIEVEF